MDLADLEDTDTLDQEHMDSVVVDTTTPVAGEEATIGVTMPLLCVTRFKFKVYYFKDPALDMGTVTVKVVPVLGLEGMVLNIADMGTPGTRYLKDTLVIT